ncbi:hypothetical protein L5515_013295 [Caenorhabditis briggsae]|uniref:Fucosyltransferase n=1 Tax=Caenorhabditis briggsae TaxID=6238 RepID=A0AAE9E8S3_CAEBR|nr:hypothetical protein L5515_013295 [Caenorhabditis briggsae]
MMSRKTGDAICTWKYLGQFKKLGVCAVVVLFLWYSMVPTPSMVPIWDLQDEKEEDLSGKIVIFAATNFFSAPFTNSNFQECNLNLRNACSISSHRAHFSQANAVLFHSRNINSKEISSFPFPRRQEIPYVMVAYESPYNAKLETYKDFFNWTMSYRIDSDVFAPYGGLLRNSELVKVNYAKIWRSKTKGTLWLVSNNNVNNKRKKIVEKLIENGMKVDLYGKVYNREPDNCPRDGAQEGCDERFQSPYKFVIAFENSNCKDYVTEKFWRKAEQYKMVPIVMSRKIYKDLGIPDNMYIAVDDFKTLKEFVEFIENLTSNEKEYMKYHKWREEFRIAEANQEIFGFCDLCQKLMDFQNRTIPKKSYSSLIAWHNEENCDNSFVDRYL